MLLTWINKLAKVLELLPGYSSWCCFEDFWEKRLELKESKIKKLFAMCWTCKLGTIFSLYNWNNFHFMFIVVTTVLCAFTGLLCWLDWVGLDWVKERICMVILLLTTVMGISVLVLEDFVLYVRKFCLLFSILVFFIE